MSDIVWPQKHPTSNEWYYVVWCDEDGTNDGTADDGGELQGRTLSSITWTVPSGLTQVSANTSAVTINAVAYSINTVAAVKISGGTDLTDYQITCAATFSDSSVVAKNVLLPVRSRG